MPQAALALETDFGGLSYQEFPTSPDKPKRWSGDVGRDSTTITIADLNRFRELIRASCYGGKTDVVAARLQEIEARTQAIELMGSHASYICKDEWHRYDTIRPEKQKGWYRQHDKNSTRLTK